MRGRFLMRSNAVCAAVWIAVQSAVVSSLSACPVCDTGTGEQVRAGIMDQNFGRTLIAVLLPFPILLGVVAMIHYGWPSARRERNHPSSHGGPREGNNDDR